MIRTAVVTLTVIPGFAYRQKLSSGGAGIVILREDAKQPGIAGISKTSGEAIPTANTSLKLFPVEAFNEAAALTAGLPYRNLSGVKLILGQPAEAPEVEEAYQPREVAAVDSADYRAVVKYYTDEADRFSYDLLNRDLIRFAHKSSAVRSRVADRNSVDSIRLYITGTKFRSIAKNPDLTDEQILTISALLDDIYPRGVFRELNEELRRMIAKG